MNDKKTEKTIAAADHCSLTWAWILCRMLTEKACIYESHSNFGYGLCTPVMKWSQQIPKERKTNWELQFTTEEIVSDLCLWLSKRLPHSCDAMHLEHLHVLAIWILCLFHFSMWTVVPWYHASTPKNILVKHTNTSNTPLKHLTSIQAHSSPVAKPVRKSLKRKRSQVCQGSGCLLPHHSWETNMACPRHWSKITSSLSASNSSCALTVSICLEFWVSVVEMQRKEPRLSANPTKGCKTTGFCMLLRAFCHTKLQETFNRKSVHWIQCFKGRAIRLIIAGRASAREIDSQWLLHAFDKYLLRSKLHLRDSQGPYSFILFPCHSSSFLFNAVLLSCCHCSPCFRSRKWLQWPIMIV